MTPKRFKWTRKRQAAAEELALGWNQRQAAERVGIGLRTIQRWMSRPEFREEVDRLSLMCGIASRAERLRIAKRAVRQCVVEDVGVKTEADVLAWLKFAQSETDGIKLNIASLFDEAMAVAGGGSGGDQATDSGEKSG